MSTSQWGHVFSDFLCLAVEGSLLMMCLLSYHVLNYRCEQTLFNAPGEALALTDAARLFLTSEKENWALQAPGFDEHLQAALNCYSFAIKVHYESATAVLWKCLKQRALDRVMKVFFFSFILYTNGCGICKHLKEPHMSVDVSSCLCPTGCRCTLRWTSPWWQLACAWNWAMHLR